MSITDTTGHPVLALTARPILVPYAGRSTYNCTQCEGNFKECALFIFTPLIASVGAAFLILLLMKAWEVTSNRIWEWYWRRRWR